MESEEIKLFDKIVMYCNQCYADESECETCLMNQVKQFILENEPRRKSKWIEQKSLNGNISYKCSYCGDVAYIQNTYCRICGSRMELAE